MKMPLAIGTQILVSALLIGVAAVALSNREAAYALLVAQPAKSDGGGRGDASAGAPVITAQVTMAEDLVEIEAVGTGEARQSMTLRAEDEGDVVELLFDAPKRFAAGEAVARLDDRSERLAVALAETRLAEAQRKLDRQLRLEKAGAASTALLDEAKTAVDVAEIELEQARETLAERVVLAPFDGVTGMAQVEIGDRIDRDAVIAAFDDRSALHVEFQVAEAFLSRLAIGAEVSARTPAFPGRRFEGRVEEIDSRVDPLSRAITVRAEIPNREDLLRPGMSFAVALRLGGGRYPAAPELALQWERDGAFVWRVVDGAAVKTPVRLVSRSGGLALLEGELAEGDEVVVEGVQRLRPGRPVRVLSGGAG